MLREWPLGLKQEEFIDLEQARCGYDRRQPSDACLEGVLVGFLKCALCADVRVRAFRSDGVFHAFLAGLVVRLPRSFFALYFSQNELLGTPLCSGGFCLLGCLRGSLLLLIGLLLPRSFDRLLGRALARFNDVLAHLLTVRMTSR